MGRSATGTFFESLARTFGMMQCNGQKEPFRLVSPKAGALQNCPNTAYPYSAIAHVKPVHLIDSGQTEPIDTPAKLMSEAQKAGMTEILTLWRDNQLARHLSSWDHEHHVNKSSDFGDFTRNACQGLDLVKCFEA